MIKFRVLCLAVIVVMLATSCNTRHYNYEVKEIDFVNKTGRIVEGVECIRGEMALDDVLLCDTFLIFMTYNTAGYMVVYGKNDYRKLATLCLEGRARNEFIHPATQSNQWFYNSENEVIVQLVDNLSTIKFVNVTKSVKLQTTVVLSEVLSCPSLVSGSSVFLDGGTNRSFEYYRAVEDEVVEGKYHVPTYSITDNEGNVKQIKVFPKLMRFADGYLAPFVYFGSLCKHPTKNLIVQPFQYMDYILRFDMDNDDYYAVHQIGSVSFDDVVPEQNDNDVFCFTSYSCVSDYVFLLYKAGDYSRSFPDYKTACPELYVFDWDLNYLGGIKLGQTVHDIAFDEESCTLIGVNRISDMVYSFDLADFMESIALPAVD